MKGIAYLDADAALGFRTQEFLDEIDPGFLANNRDLILKAWRFDTDDVDTVRTMFKGMRFLKVNDRLLRDFASSIGFDMSVFRTLQ